MEKKETPDKRNYEGKAIVGFENFGIL